jgi:magnesium chelatase subunit D
MAADQLRRMGVGSMIIDCETGRFRLGLARVLSQHLGGDHVVVDDVAASTILDVVRHGRAA